MKGTLPGLLWAVDYRALTAYSFWIPIKIPPQAQRQGKSLLPGQVNLRGFYGWLCGGCAVVTVVFFGGYMMIMGYSAVVRMAVDVLIRYVGMFGLPCSLYGAKRLLKVFTWLTKKANDLANKFNCPRY